MHRDRVITVKALKTSDNSVVVLKLIENCGLNDGVKYIMEQFKMYDSPFLVRCLNNSEDKRWYEVRTREVCHRLGCNGVL